MAETVPEENDPVMLFVWAAWAPFNKNGNTAPASMIAPARATFSELTPASSERMNARMFLRLEDFCSDFTVR